METAVMENKMVPATFFENPVDKYRPQGLSLRNATQRVLNAGDGFVLNRILATLAEKAQMGDIQAARELFDRGFGKPVQEVIVDGNINFNAKLITDSSDLLSQLMNGKIIDAEVEEVVEEVKAE